MVKARRDALELASEVHALEAREGEKRTLRLSLPMNLNRVTLISQIMTYEDRHPDVRVEISADSGLPALIAGKTDVSLGSYYRPDPRLFALPAGICYSFIMATKKYERKYGLPETIEDLKHHTILLRYTQNLGYSNKLENGTETYYIDRGHRVQHGDAAACREMLLAGEGLAIDLTPGFVSDYLASGFVFPVLKGWHREPWHYHVYCRAGSQDDKVLRELMAYVERGVFATFANQWQFWYGKLGIPMPEGFVPQSKS
jgi:DNA-binding transcriptional LysR family regulator